MVFAIFGLPLAFSYKKYRDAKKLGDDDDESIDEEFLDYLLVKYKY